MNQEPGIWRRSFGRAFDVACSAVGLALLSPIFAAISLIVVCDDGRPIFFRQARVGRKGRQFRMWKFRTMRAGSRGASITAAGDSRITRAGAWLRRSKLDELPQLFNVLKGDMSLVGPRPEVPEYVRFEAPLWQAVLQVRPGITDVASLIYRDEEQLLGKHGDPNVFYRENVLPAKLRLNLAYLRTRSFRQDLKLILLTIRYGLFPQGFHPDVVRRAFDMGVGHE